MSGQLETILYPLSTTIRNRIDHTFFGDEPHAMEEGEWTFLIGSIGGPWREIRRFGFYATAAQSAVDEAKDDEIVRLWGVE